MLKAFAEEYGPDLKVEALTLKFVDKLQATVQNAMLCTIGHPSCEETADKVGGDTKDKVQNLIGDVLL